MARAVITSIEIHDAKLFAPTGIVYHWARGIAKELKLAARGFAPPSRSRARIRRPGTGALQAGISSSVNKVGPKQLDIVLDSSAKHTLHVHGGTAHQGFRYIYSTVGWANKGFVDELVNKFEGGGITSADLESLSNLYMHLPPGPGPRFALRVHGQRANPFLVDGYNLVAKGHQSLKGIRTKFRN